MSREDGKSLGKAVVDGELKYLSVSQVTKFDPSQYGGCERRWWFNKVAGKPEPQQAAQTLGVEIHKQAEHYLKTGEDVLGAIARAGKHFMPTPLSVNPVGLKVEHEFTIESRTLTADGVPFVGYMDVVNARGEYINPQGQLVPEPGVIELLDWKSTGNLEFAKTGPQLAETVQMLGYAEWASNTYPDADWVRLSHVYFQTRGPKRAVKATHKISLATVKRGWQAVEETVKRMKQVARETDPLKVPANRNSCGAYKGCPFQLICPREPAEALVDLMGGGKTMSLLDRLKNKNQAPTNPTVQAQKEALQREMEALEAAEKAGQQEQEVPMVLEGQAAADFAKANGMGIIPAGAKVLTGGRGILPPDAPASTPAKAAAPVPAETIPTLPPAVQEAAKAQAAEVAADPPAEPKKRGRKPKAKGPAEEAVTHVESPVSGPKADLVGAAYEVGKMHGAEDAAGGLWLFVDTLPETVPANMRGMVESLDPYIEKTCAALAEEFNAADIRCAPSRMPNGNDSPLAFGKWKGALAALVKAKPPEGGFYTVTFTRESEIKQVVVEALKGLCTFYVRCV